MLSKLGENCIEEQGSLTFNEWDAKIKYRGIDFKTGRRLDVAIEEYDRKIPALQNEIFKLALANSNRDLFPEYQPKLDLGDISRNLVEELARLKDKYACCLKELEFRKQNLVSRTLHGTIYYIDLDGGNDGNNGLSTGAAWLTLEKYTTVTLRSAGDIAKVRANTDEIPVGNIALDESGNPNNDIEIRGCSIADDPWGDASDVKPIIDFNTNANYLHTLYDMYWRFYRLEIKNTTAGTLIWLQYSVDITFEDCVVHKNTFGDLITMAATRTLAKNCEFYDATGMSIDIGGFLNVFENCTFNNGNDGNANYVVYGYNLWGAEFIDCTFGSTTQHNTATFYFGRSSWYNHDPIRIRCRNCKFDDPAILAGDPTEDRAAGYYFRSEDHNQVAGASYAQYWNGIIERDSSVQLDSLDSAKLSPTADCGANQVLAVSGSPPELTGDYQIWCPASVTTITIKARETAAWTTNPSATEFYFEASYLSADSGGARATQASSQTLSGTTEVGFTMTFTPVQAGWVYVRCNLRKYEAGKSINVSVKPTVS